MSINKIVLIGAGNMATQLGKALHQKGKNILQVLSRTQGSADLLAGQINSTAIINPNHLINDADLYILAVPDDEISGIANTINIQDRLIVHTSGSVGMEVLKNASAHYGVFYPLQTFSKTRDVDFSDIPICIEASCEENYISLINLAEGISNDVRRINSIKRQTIHLAAVFASNFTNYMYGLSEEILKNEDISFDIIQPLIRETTKKIEHKSPKDAQTGPAKRKDLKIIEKHLQLLQGDPDKKAVYDLLSKLIVESH
ncbi:MAG: hypothetical protein B6D64_01280 [Bacteroidetes bacterium 4484_276]|nr:MAG: hypothetical protein B6D64_01280 [Bacteroidetes bacterium 4484_276]OYT14198.1 MAG: NADP oxidoreductase [Bacteroidetes bacterium 4572_114]